MDNIIGFMTLPKIESQNIEYKESWRDEYLKWICGFANAQGGTIYVGVDDSRNVTGVTNVKKLLEDIPNKIVNHLGIVCETKLLKAGDLDYIEIDVESSNVPISYHGKYHYRSGATKQELNGTALQQFVLKKMGRSWDEYTRDTASIDDIDRKAVDYFVKKGIDAGNDVGKETGGNVGKENNPKLNDRQQIILGILSLYPMLTAVDLSVKMSVNKRTIERDLSLLQNQGYLLREGGRKEGSWKVIGK